MGRAALASGEVAAALPESAALSRLAAEALRFLEAAAAAGGGGDDDRDDGGGLAGGERPAETRNRDEEAAHAGLTAPAVGSRTDDCAGGERAGPESFLAGGGGGVGGPGRLDPSAYRPRRAAGVPWELAGGGTVRGELPGGHGAVRAGAMCTGRVCWGTEGGAVLVHRAGPGGGPGRARALAGHSGAVHCVAAWRGWLVSGSADGTARVWDVTGGGRCVAVLRGHAGGVRALAGAGREGALLVCGCGGRGLRVWVAGRERGAWEWRGMEAREEGVRAHRF